MIKRLHELPAVLTCFAYRQEYFAELEGMLQTVREHHPGWPLVVGRGPVADCERPTFELESPLGTDRWSFPVAIELDGSEHDWRKITRMKAWWISRVWHAFGGMAAAGLRRVLWLDADARLNGPLDIGVDPEAETVAGPWWNDPENPAHSTICSGVVLFQGSPGGPVQAIIDRWSRECQAHILNMRDPTVPWLDGDQEVLTEVMQEMLAQGAGFSLSKLEHDKYAAYANKDGTTLPGALVDQWQMSRKMKFPECRERDWPPPETARRAAAKAAASPAPPRRP